MTEPFGYGYTRIRSNGSVKYDDFNGDIEFVCNNSESDRWISPKNSYISLRLRIVQTTKAGVAGCLSPIVNEGISEAAATIVSIPYINPNPAAAIFTAASFNIGEETISNNQNIAPCNTVYRSLYESRQEQDTINSTNPIKVMSMNDADTTANKTCILSDYFTGYPDNLANLTSRKLWALKNMMGFNKFNEIDIETQCLTPAMYSDSLIPPNTPFSIRLTVDSMFHLNLINIAGSNISSLPVAPATPTAFTISRLTSANSNTGTLNNIGVAIIDANLWLYRVHMPDAVSIPRQIYIKQYSSTLHTITGTHDEWNVDFKKMRRLTHIALAFVQKKGTMKSAPTDLSSGFYIGATNGGTDTPNAAAVTEAITQSGSPIMQLQNLRIEYAGAVYPYQPYEYNFDFKTTGVSSKGTYRSFYDFCNFSDGLRDRNGILLDASQYMVSPIVLFKTFQAPNNDDNTCLIVADFKTNITNCNILAMGFYDEVCRLNFDQYGKYVDFALF